MVSEEFLDLNNNFFSNSRLNTTFSDILEADLCLTIGTNVRLEASLLNIRIKKRIKKGNFIKASVGSSDNFLYTNFALGNSTKTLVQISEGRHPFCKSLIKSKKPFIIVGAGVKRRLDSASIDNLLKSLEKQTTILSTEWHGLNFLPLTMGNVNSNFLGVSQQSCLNFANKKFIFCVGLDSYEKILKKTNMATFVVVQTPHSDTLLKNANLILPSTTFLEKEATFLNLEGRAQKTAVALKSPGLARADSQILQALFASSFKTPKNPISLFSKIEDNKRSFINQLSYPTLGRFNKFYKSSFKTPLSNFFVTNAITKNSLIMAKCFLAFKQNYKNFV